MHLNSQAKLAEISQVKINCNKFSQVRLARFVKQLRSVRMGNGAPGLEDRDRKRSKTQAGFTYEMKIIN